MRRYTSALRCTMRTAAIIRSMPFRLYEGRRLRASTVARARSPAGCRGRGPAPARARRRPCTAAPDPAAFRHDRRCRPASLNSLPCRSAGIGFRECIVRKAQLEHLARRVLRDQLAWRAFRDDLRLVHHDEAIAQLLRLVHVVRRQQQRGAAPLQLVQAIPHRRDAPADRVPSSARRAG